MSAIDSPDRKIIGTRTSQFNLAGNRNAPHILNYAYAVLESEIRIKAISEGYDPTIGIMHEGSDGSSKFIFDLMVPERPKVDRAVLDFVRSHVFDPADFVLRRDGVCRLNQGNGADGSREGRDVNGPAVEWPESTYCCRCRSRPRMSQAGR